MRLPKMLLCLCAAMNINAFAAEPLKVAFVYIAPPGQAGWSFSHDEGRKAAEAAFGDKIKTTAVESVAEGPDAERVMRNLAADGNQLIFGTTFGYMDPMLRAARQFPKVYFQHATGFKTAHNLGTYDIRTYEGAYLAGVVAGKMTKTNKLGMVASFPIPEVIRNINAFTIGARSVNPDAQTRVIWVNSWYDPGKEREAALTMISQGVDVLMQNTDSPGVVAAAEEKGVYAFGWDSDFTAYGPKAHLAASVLDWGVWYKQAISGVLAGNFKGDQQIWYGLKEGAIALKDFGPMVPEDVKTLVSERSQAIIDGTRPVYMGPLNDQEGKERVAAGTSLDDTQMHGMNFFVEGVIGQLPNAK